MASQKRTDVWNALLDAEMFELYWSCEAQRYSAHDRIFAVAAAILSSGTVAALFTTLSASVLVGKVIASCACVVTIYHAKIYHSGRLKQLAVIATRWKEMAIEYGLLRAEIESNAEVGTKSWKEYESISRREKNIDESSFRIHDGRMRNAQNQIFKARRLQKDDHRTKEADTAADTAPAGAETDPRKR